MAIEALLGSVIGGALRLAPEVLTFLDKKNERKHELALGDQQYRVVELQTKTQLDIKDLDVEQSQFVSAMQALTEGVKSQGSPTGIQWVDAISSLVRPTITSWIFALYTIVKIAQVRVAMSMEDTTLQALIAVWTPDDNAMLGAVVMFWFVGRVWKHHGTRLNS